MEKYNLPTKDLKTLFGLADQLGKKRYNKLTEQDFQDYLKFNYWRYINGDYECGTTVESQTWVREHSDHFCPVCSERYQNRGGKTIDHKLPRSQYPWLSLEWSNLWVICRDCNRKKGEMHWYEYEKYIYQNYPDDYPVIRSSRPLQLLNSLK